MKKMLLLAIAAMPFITYAQSDVRLISDAGYKYPGGSVAFNDSNTYTYSGNRGAKWVTGAFNVPPQYKADTVIGYGPVNTDIATFSRSIYTFDGNNNFLTNRHDLGNINPPTFNNDFLDSMFYDASNNMVAQHYHTWNGTQYNRYLITANQYNTSQKITNYTYRLYDILTDTLQSGKEMVYTYDGNGLLTQAQTSDLDIVSGVFNLSSRSTYTYNSGNQATAMLTEKYLPATGIYRNMGNTIYTYTGQQLTHTLTQSWDSVNSAWNNVSAAAYVFDANGHETSDSTLYANAGVLAYTSANAYTYLPDSNIGEHIIYTYNSTTQAWVNYYRETRTYTSFHYPEYTHAFEWTGSAWAPSTTNASRHYNYLYSPTIVANTPGIKAILSPNPAMGSLQVALNEDYAKVSLLKVYDVQGKLMLQQPSTGKITLLDVSMLAPGSYVLELQGAGTRSQQMFVKR